MTMMFSKVMLGVMLMAASAQAQDVTITVGRTYTIPYVAGYPGAWGVAVQVNAIRDGNLVMGLANNVVLPSDNPAGTYTTYVDHYHDGAYHFIGLMWGAPAEVGVLPVRVMARRAGAWDLKVKQCVATADTVAARLLPECVDSVTHVTAIEAGGVAGGQLERVR